MKNRLPRKLKKKLKKYLLVAFKDKPSVYFDGFIYRIELLSDKYEELKKNS